jgi:uncharacterized membrane protein
VSVSYREVFTHVVEAVEAVGATILVLGGLGAFIRFGRDSFTHRRADPYHDLRRHLGRIILLGLEVLIIADIIRTIVVDQTVESAAILGVIVLIRIVLSFSLEAEVDGVWPWNRWRTRGEGTPRGGD